MSIVDTIEGLRAWVGADPRRGFILEEDRALPARDDLTGIADRLPRLVHRWRASSPGEEIPEVFHDRYPASFVELVRRYGSVTWVAPAGASAGHAFPLRGSSPDVFLALSWPVGFEAADLVDALGQEIDDDVEGFEVFHDGHIDGAAFDRRIRNAAGEHLVVEGFDDHTVVDRIRSPRPAVSTKTFEVWLAERIAAVKATLP